MLKQFGFLSFYITIEILDSENGYFPIPNVSNNYQAPYELHSGVKSRAMTKAILTNISVHIQSSGQQSTCPKQYLMPQRLWTIQQ